MTIRFLSVILVCCFGFSVALALPPVGDNVPKKKTKRSRPEVKISGFPLGPSRAALDTAVARLSASSSFQTTLGGSKYRVISSEYIDNGTPTPTRFRAVIYDYTNDRTYSATGDAADNHPVSLNEEAFQPGRSDDEFAEAASIVRSSTGLADSFASGGLSTYEPMPPITVLNGTIERLVNVGILSITGSVKHEIVGVSLKRGAVVHYPDGAPPSARAIEDVCGPPANIPGGPNGSGQIQINITQGSTSLWQMLVSTPIGSSGTNGSGIELQNVKYRGKSVFKRAHVPILDVQYAGNLCGPFRDWTNQQSAFSAPAAGATFPNVDINGGFIILADGQVATTVLETGDDGGNFRGVAIYRQNNETVMVTEMGAGWYRYIMEWRFADDGTIKPRFGFGAVADSCTCNIHFHHAYWRFDFDVVNSVNNVFQVERGRKFLQPITTEMSGIKNFATNKRILVQNASGDEAYMLIPNLSDGKADAFAVADIWVLRAKPPTGDPVTSEIDDGILLGQSADPSIHISPWVNGESLVNQDVVVWYGAHFTHDDADFRALNSSRSGNIISGSHVVGPDLRPIRW